MHLIQITQKIERLSVFDSISTVIRRQHQTTDNRQQTTNNAIHIKHEWKAARWKECRQKQEEACQQEEACGSKGRDWWCFRNDDVATRIKPCDGSAVVQNFAGSSGKQCGWVCVEVERRGARQPLLDHGRQGQWKLLPDHRPGVHRVSHGRHPTRPQPEPGRFPEVVPNAGGHLDQGSGRTPGTDTAVPRGGHRVCTQRGEKGHGTGAGSQVRAHSDARVHAGWLRDGPVAVQAWKGEGQRLGERVPQGAQPVLHEPTRSGAGDGGH